MDEAQPAGQRCGIVFHSWVCLGFYFSRFLVRRLGGSLVGRVRNAPQPRRKTLGLGKKLAHRRGGAVALAENGRETVAKVQQIRDKPNRNLIFRFNGYFPLIGYVVSFRIVLTSPTSKYVVSFRIVLTSPTSK